MANRTFRLKPAADADLTSIFRYTSRVFGPLQAELYLRQLNESFYVLASHPCIGKAYGAVKPGLRGYPVGSHILFYQPTAYGVVVLRILHKSMDYPGHI